MGLQDRDYYQYQAQGGFSGFSFNRNSIVAILVMINVAVFVVDAFTPRVPLPAELQEKIDAVQDPGLREQLSNRFAPRMQTLSYQLGVRYIHPWYVWNYLTYGFAHSSLATETSFWHLLGNMFTLFFLGRAVEEALGRKEFLRFYLISIIVCGIGFTLFRHLLNYQFNCLVGASGGVAAVTALFVLMFPRVTIYLFGVLPMRAWILGIILLVHNFFIALKPESSTAWEAHLIGFAFGAAYFYGKWNFSSFQIGKFNKRKIKLKVHDPDQIDEQLQLEADRILKKISEQGETNLTRQERGILTRYSERLRERRQ